MKIAHIRSVAGLKLTPTQGRLLTAFALVVVGFIVFRWITRRQVLDPSNDPGLMAQFDALNPGLS